MRPSVHIGAHRCCAATDRKRAHCCHSPDSPLWWSRPCEFKRSLKSIPAVRVCQCVGPRPKLACLLDRRAPRRVRPTGAAAARTTRDTPYLFVPELGRPLTDHTVRKLIKRTGENAGLEFSVHPHMLRHAGGHKLANDGHDTRALQKPYKWLADWLHGHVSSKALRAMSTAALCSFSGSPLA